MWYRCLDIAFFVFHSAFIMFILCGWCWRRTRLAHFAAVVLTAFSWFGLGLFYGFGYCPCTDWHWQVRVRLGYTGMPWSYIKFLLDIFTGGDWPEVWVDALTVVLFFVAAGLSVFLCLRDGRFTWKRPSAT